MKVQLELVLPDDGGCYLNYWDAEEGNDVCCFVGADGHLALECEPEDKIITIAEFISMVKDRVGSRNEHNVSRRC